MADARDRREFLNIFRSCLNSCISELEGRSVDRDYNNFRLDLLYNTTLRYAEAFELDESVVQLISEAKDLISEGNETELYSTFDSPLVFSGQPGRPKFLIPEEILRFLLDKCFTVKNMATLLGVSQRTVERRMNEFGLCIGSCYSDISDSDLERTVRNLILEYPNVGYKRMSGLLLARGLRIQQDRIRQVMRSVDPHGTLLRTLSLRVIHRWSYHVSGPLSLDGNHKLKRWRFVAHAGIDGYSRMLVFVQCSTNNRAETVLNLFQSAVQSYGLPLRVRTDKGGENVGIAQFMLLHPLRGPGRASHITGRSVHNERIERFWRDLFTGCTSLFYHLFYHMESSGILDASNEIHLFSLHYVYLPIINRNLLLFQQGHNRSPIRTERNLSPQQLWVQGFCVNAAPDPRLSQEFCTTNDAQMGNINLNEGIENYEQVTIPNTTVVLNERDLVELTQAIDPLRQSNCYGVDIYLEVLQFVHARLNLDLSYTYICIHFIFCNITIHLV